MTTHDKDKIVAAAREAGLGYFRIKRSDKTSVDSLERFYAIAFEAGRKAEREETNKTGKQEFDVQCFPATIRARSMK